MLSDFEFRTAMTDIYELKNTGPEPIPPHTKIFVPSDHSDAEVVAATKDTRRFSFEAHGAFREGSKFLHRSLFQYVHAESTNRVYAIAVNTFAASRTAGAHTGDFSGYDVKIVAGQAYQAMAHFKIKSPDEMRKVLLDLYKIISQPRVRASEKWLSTLLTERKGRPLYR